MKISNLSHPTIQARIYAAMRYAVNVSNQIEYKEKVKDKMVIAGCKGFAVSCVLNKKGENFLYVNYYRKAIPSFSFNDANGKDCTDVVIKSLRMN